MIGFAKIGRLLTGSPFLFGVKMKRSLLSVCISVGMGMTNSTQKPPTEPHDYYKITNSAGRNVIHLDGFIGYWGDEAYWLKNYLKEHEGKTSKS